jgi:hypothetical protein
MKLKLGLLALVMALLFTGTTKASSAESEQQEIVQKVVNDAFLTLVYTSNPGAINRAFTIIEQYWQPAYIPPLLDTISVSQNVSVISKTIELLTTKTGKDFGRNINGWFFWLWNQPEELTSDYGNFKADLYGQIDPKFETYFRGRQSTARIRLDEVRWGGVVQDGIPPLHNPQMIPAARAKYLEGDNIIFGVTINGDARAYPKRILAWHEMFTDTIGGVDIAGVYCTLCGTVIPYKTNFDGVDYKLGTSGFLYRSNKLMYDQATQSLWSTARGEPVIGPLVDKGIVLEHVSVVTTTWAEWQRRHPDTTVLSLDTGHQRDYGEGVAYKRYFASDQLMFNTPFQNTQLRNKQEVLALTFPAAPQEQLAIDTEFLNKNPLYKDKIGPQKILVLTDTTGANRVYDPKDIDFVAYDRDSTLTDSNGATWKLSEDKLVSFNNAISLSRLPSRNAFWFGWHAAFPDTRLIK